MRSCIRFSTVCLLVLIPMFAWAAHPLITDDTGTQGKGKFQLEVNGQYDYDKETQAGVTMKTTGGQAAATLSYGVVDNTDLAVSIPYLWTRMTSDGAPVSNEKGISDASFELKWRFWEKEGVSLALKPGISFPTGNENRGLGSGETGYHVYLFGSKEAEPWAFHANLGYIRNDMKFDVEARNLWHVSLATTYSVQKNLKIAADTGIERDADKTSHIEPAYFLGGIIYSVNEDLDIDLGVKHAVTTSETDVSVMAGTTYRF